MAYKDRLYDECHGYDIDGNPIPDELAEVWCDRCEMLMINGVACHEIGCPNMGARWDRDSGEWIAQRECFDCGCTVDRDDPCCSASNDDEEDFYRSIEERLDALEDGGESEELSPEDAPEGLTDEEARDWVETFNPDIPRNDKRSPEDALLDAVFGDFSPRQPEE